MHESLVKMNYFETYYYSNIIKNVLSDTVPYLRNLHNWYEDREVELFLQPFPRWSILHEFSYFIIESLMYERFQETEDNISSQKIWIDLALKYHGIEAPGFNNWLKESNINFSAITAETVYEYHTDLRLTGEIDMLLNRLTQEVFYVLFGNRSLLAELNMYVAGIVSGISKDDLGEDEQSWLRSDGVPARVNIPEWARKAVFFRDRGMCACCNKDLSGLISINQTEHYDHIIPLAEGGINDVTNLQVLCASCNLKKGSRIIQTSSQYQSWYSIKG